MKTALAYAAAHPLKIETVRDEGDGGYWAPLMPGWYCPLAGSHCCHERTVRKLIEVMWGIQPCDCEDCKVELVRSRKSELAGLLADAVKAVDSSSRRLLLKKAQGVLRWIEERAHESRTGTCDNKRR